MVIMAATMLATALWMIACAGGGPPTGTGGAGGTKTTTTRSTGGAGTTTSGAVGTGGAQDAGMPPAPECPANIEQPPCMRYKILLLGNPTTDIALRNKYIAAFGDACYVADDAQGTFNCFYIKWQKACADAAKIGEVFGGPNAAYDQGYTCKPDGVGNYTLQIGSDVANVTYIDYQAAPRQTPLTDITGMGDWTAVNGPYRNLTDPDPQYVGPGGDFDINSGMSDGDGGFLDQRDYIIQVNKNANGGKIRSDLAGYPFAYELPDGGVVMVTEQEFLDEADTLFGTNPNVHHVVPRRDKRCCPWGTNTYKNAAVISRKLNEVLSNDNPTPQEVQTLNDPAKAYAP
jgi:hypothetical protein